MPDGPSTLSVRLGPLAEREFRLLFAGRVVSLAGSAIAPIAIAFAVLDLTGSASDLGLVLAAGWMPQIVFILVGGVWADRLPRNVVMVGSNLLSGAAQGGVALLRLSLNFTNVGGAAIGGLLVAGVGSGWAIAFDAATYLASASILSRMRIAASARAGGRDFVRELREGWSEFRSRTWLWAVVVQAGIGNMVWTGGLLVLGPVIARDELGGAAIWGAILACQSVGLVLGGLIALRIQPQRMLFVGTAALLLLAPVLALLALGVPAVFVAGSAVLSGLGLELFSVFWDTSLQQHVPLDVLSRVSSYDALGSFVAIPIGLSIAGPLSDAIGVHETLWIAVAVQVAATLAVLGVRDVRELRRLDASAPT